MRSSPGRSSSTPGTWCRSSTRWCAGWRSTGCRWRTQRPGSGSPAPRTTRRPRRWPRVGCLRWCRPGPALGGRTSSPSRCSRHAEELLAADASLRPADLVEPLAEEFGVRVHPRSIERALGRRRSRKSGPRSRLSRPLGRARSTGTNRCGRPPSAAAPTAGGWGSECSPARGWPGGSAPPRPAPNPCRNLPRPPRAVVPACPAVRPAGPRELVRVLAAMTLAHA